MYKCMVKCSVEEMNEKINYLKKNKRIFINRAPKEGEHIGGFKVFLFKKISTVHLIYKDLKGKGTVKQMSAHLDREFDGIRKNGANALSILSKYYKAPEINTRDDAVFAIGISPYRNKKFIGKRVLNCYSYDLNSAYPFGMLQELPDTTQKLPAGKVRKDEYSFTLSGRRSEVGSYSLYRFKAMKSPYIKFVETWYSKKANALNSADKNTAKFVMNAAIGALQNHNCFLRAAIIDNFHSYILSIFNKYKEHVLSMNVDSIVSDIRIPELDNNLGNEIGQWKIEHKGDFAIHKNGFSVQWNRDIPAYGAGIPKAWFTNGYDILVDELPTPKNIYSLDEKSFKIKKGRR